MPTMLQGFACALAMSSVMVTPGSQGVAADPIVAHAIALARAHALNAAHVDWPAVEREAARLMRSGVGDDARTRAIRHVVHALGDGHSFYRPPSSGQPAVTTTSPAPAARGIARSVETADGFGHLVIASWSGPDAEMAAAAHRVRDALLDAMEHDACGLVIDVADNGGGNMWPMMGGIAPLYEDGTLLQFESRTGRRRDVDVRGGALHAGGKPLPDVDDLAAVAVRPRNIALLLGPRTASSAEILALGFRGQANVRSFGRPTRGATSANSSFPLANGGLLAITTGRLRDRAGNVQQGSLWPDEPAENALDAATRWLRVRCRS